MSEIINLFPGNIPTQTESPAKMMTRLLPDANQCDKAVTILIRQRGANWEIDFYQANMNNGETILACEIVRDRILAAVLGK